MTAFSPHWVVAEPSATEKQQLIWEGAIYFSVKMKYTLGELTVELIQAFYSCIPGTRVAGLPRRLALVTAPGAFSVSDLTLPTTKGRSDFGV